MCLFGVSRIINTSLSGVSKGGETVRHNPHGSGPILGTFAGGGLAKGCLALTFCVYSPDFPRAPPPKEFWTTTRRPENTSILPVVFLWIGWLGAQNSQIFFGRPGQRKTIGKMGSSGQIFPQNLFTGDFGEKTIFTLFFPKVFGGELWGKIWAENPSFSLWFSFGLVTDKSSTPSHAERFTETT